MYPVYFVNYVIILYLGTKKTVVYVSLVVIMATTSGILFGAIVH